MASAKLFTSPSTTKKLSCPLKDKLLNKVAGEGRWLFLAWLSKAEACAFAAEPRGMVGGEAGAESGARFAGDAHFAQGWLAGGSDVGMRSGEEEVAACRSTGEPGVGTREGRKFTAN